MIGTGAIVGRFFLISALAFVTWAVFVPVPRASCDLVALPPLTVDVQEAAFGVDAWNEDEGVVFLETDHIHLVPGTSFGWRLKLSAPDTAMLLREEFILPSPPAYWGISSETVLSDDRRVAITERVVTPDDGWLDGRWTVTPGDPAGPYQLRVFLDGALVQTFFVTAE